MVPGSPKPRLSSVWSVFRDSRLTRTIKIDIDKLNQLDDSDKVKSYLISKSMFCLLGCYIDTYGITQIEFYDNIIHSGDVNLVDRCAKEIAPLYVYSYYIGFEIEPATQRSQNINKKELIEFNRIYLKLLTQLHDVP